MYVGVDGKARQVQKAYIGVNGVAKLWYQLGTPLKNLAVGSTVKIKVNGTDYDWIIVHQGLPGSMYDASCNGIWLLMKSVYTTLRWDDFDSSYNDSEINTYLNGTFYNLIDSNVRNIVKQVKIPYSNRGKVQSGANGLSTKVFLLSGTEVGLSGLSSMNTEGAKLAYFDSANKRVAYNGGSAAKWWLRSQYTGGRGDQTWYVNTDGSYDKAYSYRSVLGVRPCMILPQDALVDDNGYVIGA